MVLIFVTNWQPVGFMILYSDEEYIARLEEIIQLIHQAKAEGSTSYYHLGFLENNGVGIIGTETAYMPEMGEETRAHIDRMLQEYTEMP